MKHALLLLFALLVAGGAAAQDAEYTDAPIEIGDDYAIKRVKYVLNNIYTAIANGDTATYRGHTTPEFVFIENGVYRDQNYGVDKILPAPRRNYTRETMMNFQRIEQQGDMAFAIWDNDLQINHNGNEVQQEWTESAVLQKINGRWKVRLLHSTLIREE